MKKLAFALFVVLALLAGCRDHTIFLPFPFTLVGSWTIQGDVGTFYVDTVFYAASIGPEAIADAGIGDEATLDNIYVESVTYTIVGNRVPGSLGSCSLRFRRNDGPDLTLASAVDVDLDAVIGVTTPLVPEQAGVDTLRDVLSDAIEGSNDTLKIWVEGTTVPDEMDFDVEVAITFTLVRAQQLSILAP